MKTKDLKNLLENFNNIVKVDNIRPITSFVEMFCENGIFRIGCTNNYYKVVGTLLDDTPLDNIVLDRVRLLKLLKLTTKEDVFLIKKDDYVEFVGNGTYKLAIQLDEVGNEIQLNLAMPKLENPINCTLSDIVSIYNRNKLSLYDGSDNEQFKQYYNGDCGVVTTNSITVCTTKGKLPFKQLNPNIMQLLAKLPTDFSISEVTHGIRVDCDCMNISLTVNNAVDEFPIKMVSPFCSTDLYDCTIKVSKADLAQTLKRQLLFINAWQKKVCIMSVSDSTLTITNETNEFNESIVGCDIIGENYSKLVFSTEIALNILSKLDSDITIYACNKCVGFEDSKSLYVLCLQEVAQ